MLVNWGPRKTSAGWFNTKKRHFTSEGCCYKGKIDSLLQWDAIYRYTPKLAPSHQICCDPNPLGTDLYCRVFPLLFSHYADCLLTEVIGVPASHRKPAITRLLDLISAEGSMPWSEAMSATKPEYEYANEHVSAVIHTSGSLWWIVRANNTGESGTPSSQPIEHLLRMFVELLKLNLTRTPKQTDCVTLSTCMLQ